ncbi:MAG: penicillin acylase family protein, partial [Henriciella sp.]
MKQAGQRLIRRIATAILALGVTALLVTAIWAWHPLPSNPNSTSLRTGSTLYSAEIIRDEWGVPHIFGTRDADTAFGVGYAHAEDDFETIQEVVAATRGVLARYRGLDGAATDYVVNLLGIWDTVETYYDDQVGPETKAIAEAYAAGLNLYASENPDAIWAGLAPFMAEDIIAGFVLKTPFFYGLDETLLELLAETRDAALATPPQQQAWLLNPTLNLVSGSNAFAVAPTRSADGVTRLLINSHQPMTGPVAWWEAHLVSQQGLDIQGGLFPGSPVILHGFNRHLGWANTVSKPDLVDVYRLRINPENPNQYWLDGAWAEL